MFVRGMIMAMRAHSSFENPSIRAYQFPNLFIRGICECASDDTATLDKIYAASIPSLTLSTVPVQS